MDKITPQNRSLNMAQIRAKDTKPEIIVRKLTHGLGYRFRLHRRDLPGCPDMVFPARYKIIFIHGCFWHGHNCKEGVRKPKSNSDYWNQKITRNAYRDKKNEKLLTASGWKILNIWECQMRDEQFLRELIISFLEPSVNK